ncbi:MAG: ATP-binding cassette domain-containing protein, partial [Coriobacteriales bacterium]|nr:ATP-binding cassette domain-containing protein [Coriobacteriales bacterium]
MMREIKRDETGTGSWTEQIPSPRPGLATFVGDGVLDVPLCSVPLPAPLAPFPAPAAHGPTIPAPSHAGEPAHHHHEHAQKSHHVGGHHLLQVEDLSISFRMYDPSEPRFFRARRVPVPVIHKLHIGVHSGEIVAIVGASGSGKTLLADSIMGLFEPNATVKGRVWFDGIEQDATSLAALRGNGISLVPQSVNYLDPLMKIGRQVKGRKGHEAATRLTELFERYDLPPEVANWYPHELSGGMARRVLLCCALMDDPQVIIADEPTPGLDLELAKRALADFRGFADEGKGVLLITHDIELALSVADRVAVFDDGTVIEETAVSNFSSPDTLRQPFSKALWHALPEHDFSVNCDNRTDGTDGGRGQLSHFGNACLPNE